MPRPAMAYADSTFGTPVLDIDLSGQAAGPYSLTAPQVTAAVVSGQVCWELEFAPSADLVTQGTGSPSQATLVEASTTAGLLRVYAKQTSTSPSAWAFYYTLNGSTLVNIQGQVAVAGARYRLLVSYSDTAGIARLTSICNGCADAGGSVAVTSALGTVSAIRLLSRVDTTEPITSAQLVRFRAYHPSGTAAFAPMVRGIVLGDSVIGGYSTQWTGANIYSPAEGAGWRTPRIVSLAVSGNTFAQQQTAFSASPFSKSGSIQWVLYQLGINDAGQGRTTAQIITSAQSMATTIRAALPQAKVVAALPTPCRAGVATGVWAELSGFIAALRAGSVTGLDGLVTAHYASLDDGTGALQTGLQLSPQNDGIHPSNAARATIGAAWRAQLAALGLL